MVTRKFSASVASIQGPSLRRPGWILFLTVKWTFMTSPLQAAERDIKLKPSPSRRRAGRDDAALPFTIIIEIL